jgi:hypothetical protein
MKLDRNINPDGAGKYALLKMRQLNGTVPAKESAHRITPVARLMEMD